MEFWMNINTHPFRSSRDPLDWSTLLLYQAKQRKLWHQAINSPGHRYNLSQINEELLHQTKDRLYWSEQEQRDNALGKDYVISVSMHHKAIFTDNFHVLFSSSIHQFHSTTLTEYLLYMSSRMLAMVSWGALFLHL